LKNLNGNAKAAGFPGASLAYFDVHFVGTSAILGEIIRTPLAIHRNLHWSASGRIVDESSRAPRGS
jgi:hypothetical protein